jgi:2-polyprenyl-3-methyl-5-hydroxy-6-metoxy-1,4-benzoquinol methylase
VFPSAVLAGRKFDAVCLLAVLEHVPATESDRFARALWDALAPDGLVVATVPAAVVDVILHVLKSVHLIHGMALEEHHGFRATDTLRVLHPPEFTLEIHTTFQCGLNNLFVFRKCGA